MPVFEDAAVAVAQGGSVDARVTPPLFMEIVSIEQPELFPDDTKRPLQLRGTYPLQSFWAATMVSADIFSLQFHTSRNSKP